MNLIDAVDNNDLQQVKCLVENDADIHVYYEEPLRLAVYNNYFDIVKYLVEHGANIRASCDWPLKWAFQYGYFNIVKYLISCYKKFELKELFSEINSFYIKYLILERLYNESLCCN
ncbi:ankyrin repeat domain-containing protein [Candidatus Pacearchaeota archaeon]|jgi:ankyrin repeat protein|nr:ankyrin repeat domain-containing protein [Candidatus Pacearchaeota archaeon]